MYSHIKIPDLQERIANAVQAVINATEIRESVATAQNDIYAIVRNQQQEQLENLVTLAAMGEETPEVVYKKYLKFGRA